MWQTLINNILKFFRMGGGATPQRVDFEAVTQMWEHLSDKLSHRVEVLERNLATLEDLLDACRKRHNAEHIRANALEDAVQECQRQRVKLEARVKHLEEKYE